MNCFRVLVSVAAFIFCSRYGFPQPAGGYDYDRGTELLILQGRQIGVMEIQASQMYGLGTPEDLERFLKTDVCAEIPL